VEDRWSFKEEGAIDPTLQRPRGDQIASNSSGARSTFPDYSNPIILVLPPHDTIGLVYIDASN
jgi:hypothetical protein